MPLYVVRSPHLTVSIVSAADEDDLRSQLDEIADPAFFVWEEYKGPLWVDFEPPVRFVAKYRDDRRPMAGDEFDLEGVKELADEGWTLQASTGATDAGAQMVEELTSFAFPSVALLEPESADELDADELEAMLKDDLVRHAWLLARKLKKEPPAKQPSRETLQEVWRILGIDALGRQTVEAAEHTQHEHTAGARGRAVLYPALTESECVTPAWSIQCHWCGRREFVEGNRPRSPGGWIERHTRNDGVFLFCSHRCEYEADEHSPVLRTAECDHSEVDEENVCKLCGLVLDTD